MYQKVLRRKHNNSTQEYLDKTMGLGLSLEIESFIVNKSILFRRTVKQY
jgi:hypothetical protein